MLLVDSLKVLEDVRTDLHAVLTTMGSGREWMKLGTHPLDFIYVPSAMGEAPDVGLGIALAQQEKQVVVCNGDGCMLMNLGCLVTISAAAQPQITCSSCSTMASTEASRCPSGAQATEKTQFSCPEGVEQSPARSLPEPHGVVGGAGGESLSVRSPGHGEDQVLVSGGY